MEFSRRHFLGAGSALAAAGLMSAAGQASAQTARNQIPILRCFHSIQNALPAVISGMIIDERQHSDI